MKYPCAISCDWLQLHLQKPVDFFHPDKNNAGYQFNALGYGSKVFKKLYKVFEPNGELLGTIALEPYSSAIKPHVAIFKVENKVLYQSNYIARIFEFIALTGFKYKGITRIDLCYDCNEYANGLKPGNLIKRYIDCDYLKIGTGNFMVHGHQTYLIKSNKLKHPTQDDIQPHALTGITFGSRKSDVCVQIYDKTKEMAEEKHKHYIEDYWKMCGINPDKPVWRTEIRIQNGGKTLQEMSSGRLFHLSINDLVTQETIEQMFHTYAKKYCRFVIRDYHAKIQQMTFLKLFSTDNEIKLRPKRITQKKDYSRMHKIIINNLDKHLAENERLDNNITHYLYNIREYYIKAYGLEKWDEERKDKAAHQAAVEGTKKPLQQSAYGDLYSYLSDEVAKRAAGYRMIIEENVMSKLEKQKRNERNSQLF